MGETELTAEIIGSVLRGLVLPEDGGFAVVIPDVLLAVPKASTKII